MIVLNNPATHSHITGQYFNFLASLMQTTFCCDRWRKKKRSESESGSAYDYVDYNDIQTSSTYEIANTIHTLNPTTVPRLPSRGGYTLKVRKQVLQKLENITL